MRNLALLALVLLLAFAATACNAGDSDDAAGTTSDSATVGSEATAGVNDDGSGSDTSVPGTTADGADSASSGSGTMLGDAVAAVNGQPIPLADFQRQAFDTQRFYVEQGLDANTEEGQQQLLYLRKQVLDDMLNQVLIEQAAAELGIEATDAELAERMKSYVEEFGGEDALTASLAQDGTTMDEIAAMERSAIVGQKLLEHITGDVPETAAFVHARHILCDTLDDCQAALDRLNAGEPFDQVAADVSKDETSAARGGDLDWIARGMLPSAQLEQEIFLLQPGQRSGVVQTDFGFHIIEVLERDEAREMSAEQRYTLREKLLMEWLDQRRRESEIEIYVDDLRDLASKAP